MARPHNVDFSNCHSFCDWQLVFFPLRPALPHYQSRQTKPRFRPLLLHHMEIARWTLLKLKGYVWDYDLTLDPRLHSICNHQSEDTCHANSKWLCDSWPPRWPNDPDRLYSHTSVVLSYTESGSLCGLKNTAKVMVCGLRLSHKMYSSLPWSLGSFILGEASTNWPAI